MSMSDMELDRIKEIEERTKEYQRTFAYENFNVVRKEMFAHRCDPAITLRNDGIVFNSACIGKMEGVVYIKILIDRKSKQLAIKQCDENDRNALRWCVERKDGSRRSRKITGKGFADMVYGMMGWSKSQRYKVMGYLIQIEGEKVFLFDLNMKEDFNIRQNRKRNNSEEVSKDPSLANAQADQTAETSNQGGSMPSGSPESPESLLSGYAETVQEDAARYERRDLSGFEEIEQNGEDHV